MVASGCGTSDTNNGDNGDNDAAGAGCADAEEIADARQMLSDLIAHEEDKGSTPYPLNNATTCVYHCCWANW